jgi:hypothetical protein
VRTELERKSRRTLEDAGLTVGIKTVQVLPNFVPTAEEKDALETLKQVFGYELEWRRADYA